MNVEKVKTNPILLAKLILESAGQKDLASQLDIEANRAHDYHQSSADLLGIVKTINRRTPQLSVELEWVLIDLMFQVTQEIQDSLLMVDAFEMTVNAAHDLLIERVWVEEEVRRIPPQMNVLYYFADANGLRGRRSVNILNNLLFVEAEAWDNLHQGVREYAKDPYLFFGACKGQYPVEILLKVTGQKPSKRIWENPSYFSKDVVRFLESGTEEAQHMLDMLAEPIKSNGPFHVRAVQALRGFHSAEVLRFFYDEWKDNELCTVLINGIKPILQNALIQENPELADMLATLPADWKKKVKESLV